ncbi:hypothetical protein HYPDE_40548 [Hyphomicrobium denitrificans 1NES1]|uniref:Uncharacterized protein n=1 Tax=Hyphomicrobium denitrificans 1NES1 TaxID=670307 RepID=N0B9S9_9HYPH|nr:hypothetical protein HYPDE_40548 [Hyphomicrobium denitrificans 1NES1]
MRSKSHPPALGECFGLSGIKRSVPALTRLASVIAQKVGIAAKKLISEGRRVERPEVLIRARRSPIGASHGQRLL